MTKEEKQKTVLEVIKLGYNGEGASKFEDILDSYDDQLVYYDSDLGYMVGFAKAVLEQK